MNGSKKRTRSLRAMRTAELLAAAIRLYRAEWKTLMLIASLVVVPFAVLKHLALQSTLIHAGRGILRPGALAVWSSLASNYVVLQPILWGSLVYALTRACLGERVTARESIGFAFSNLGALLVAVVLSSLLVVLGFAALLVPGIILAIRYEFVAAAVVVERKDGRGALGRSWTLSKGLAWHILPALFLSWIVVALVGVAISITAAAIEASGIVGSSGSFVRAILGSVATVVTAPFGAAVGLLLYMDARVRKEHMRHLA